MRRISWTSLALRDLLEIKDYIHRDKPEAARRQAQKIKWSVERLGRFPESGRKLEKIPTVREIVSGDYRIFYRTDASRIEILRVYHGRRKIPLVV